MKMKKNILFASVMMLMVVMIANSVFISAVTGSIGNAKMVLYPEVNGWTNTVIDKTILVRNVNNISVNITLKADENATKFVDVIDKTFILAPGEEKKAEIEIKVRKEGTYNGNINIFFRPAEGQEGGVVLSSDIVVIAKKKSDYQDTTNDTTTGNTDNSSGTNSTDTSDSKSNNGITKNSKAFILGGSTLLLLVVLLILLYIWGKKRNRNKNKKRSK